MNNDKKVGQAFTKDFTALLKKHGLDKSSAIVAVKVGDRLAAHIQGYVSEIIYMIHDLAHEAHDAAQAPSKPKARNVKKPAKKTK